MDRLIRYTIDNSLSFTIGFTGINAPSAMTRQCIIILYTDYTRRKVFHTFLKYNLEDCLKEFTQWLQNAKS